MINWPENTKEIIEKMRAMKLSWEMIADIFADGTTRSAVIGQINRLRVKGALAKQTDE
jgi:hypothetical protein